MKKLSFIFISLLLAIFIASVVASPKESKAKKIKDAEFESSLVDVVHVELYNPGGSPYHMWTLKFENDTVVPVLISCRWGDEREVIWFVGKKYKVWTDSETWGWRAELIELVGIPMIDQEVEKRLSKEAKK